MEFFAFDDQYVRRLREGDLLTEEHYIQYFQPLLTAKLHRLRVPSMDVEDVINDTHRRVFETLRKPEGIRDGHKFGAFVSTTCTHVAHEFARKRHGLEPLDDVYPTNDDAVRDLIRKERIERVRRALESLAKEDPKDAEILRDFFMKDLDKDEVCEKYGINRNYLRVLMHRALKKFRKKYDDPDDPDDS
jgi:RNA polymerase sigma-70 factor (ECF subfamily)